MSRIITTTNVEPSNYANSNNRYYDIDTSDNYPDTSTSNFNRYSFQETSYYDQIAYELEQKNRQLEFIHSDLRYKLSRSNETIQEYKDKLKLFIEAASIFVDPEKLQETVNKLIAAKKNEKKFNDLLDVGLNEIK